MSQPPNPSYPSLLLFPTAYLDHRRQPEPVITSPDPSVSTTNPSKPNPKPTPTHPLAANPHPPAFYSQYTCPICTTPIATAHEANFVGHTPCLHRGTCPKPKCIKAYYGRSSRGRPWGSSYAGGQTLYCQAAGCGERIEGWTLVKAVLAPSGRAVLPVVVKDPGFEKRMWEGRWREVEEEGREEQGGRKRWRRRWRKVREGTVQGCVLMGCFLCLVVWKGAMD
ncbi:hypothetical protein VTJ49DRAFT_1034 [Mycothermus thermophilus]|uniref:C2H2-type domain-containing protein n=1 Tax=Humicola insolens TaxID=85995 RepID=A0ABR3VDU2_HUMIN